MRGNGAGVPQGISIRASRRALFSQRICSVSADLLGKTQAQLRNLHFKRDRDHLVRMGSPVRVRQRALSKVLQLDAFRRR
jgi:hypothetical protein